MQITDELVSRITSALLERLGGPAAVPSAKPRLCLAGGAGALEAAVLAELKAHYEVSEFTDYGQPPPEQAAVLATSLSLQALVRLAEGDEGCTPEGRALLTALLNGRPAAVLREGLAWRRYLNSAPRALTARYARCEQILQSYGLRLVEARPGLAAALAGASGGCGPVLPAAATFTGGRRRVLTETEVMAACPASGGPGQTLDLETGALLTPLARDYILAMKINLVRSGPSGAGAAR
jgi:hypothetical protein